MADAQHLAQITDADFAQFVKSHRHAVVDAWAPWCAPCHRIAPVLDELALEYGERVAIATINTDENPQTAARFGIMSLPTLLVFRDGQRVDQLVGFAPKGALKARFDRAFGL